MHSEKGNAVRDMKEWHFRRSSLSVCSTACDPTKEKRMNKSDPAMLAFLDEQAQLFVAGRADTDELRARMSEQIRLALKDGAPRLEDIARALKLGPRTLQRRLEESGTRYRELVDSVRSQLATAHLDGSASSIGDLPRALGYSDLRAFVRAFKRWTGRSPGQYRRRNAKVNR
jgi:AraC-like DNA-binding protein